MTLRIGLVTSEFPPDHGGVETYAWQLATELGQRPGLCITVYTPQKSAAIKPPPGVTLKPLLKSCIGLDWPRLKNEPVDVWHALSASHAWIADKNRPTVVSIHGNDFLTPYPITACPALAWPLLWRLRSRIWHSFYPLWQRRTRRMLRSALPRARAIIANSRYTAEVFLQRYPECSDAMLIGQVGVDPAFFAIPRAPAHSVPLLLTVCRLSEKRKNVDRVLHALATLKDRYTFEYAVVGDGVEHAALQQLADDLGLGARVHFYGRTDDNRLRDLYARADLFVLTASVTPTSHEGFGIVYLEAAACGVPSLAARLAGAVEAVADGESGYFVESPDIDSIRDAIRQFLAGERRFDANICRNFARAFSWARVADHCESAYGQATMRKFQP
jgi:phosphatidylinositol alpha-1,6-mannosyltransferase